MCSSNESPPAGTPWYRSVSFDFTRPSEPIPCIHWLDNDSWTDMTETPFAAAHLAGRDDPAPPAAPGPAGLLTARGAWFWKTTMPETWNTVNRGLRELSFVKAWLQHPFRVTGRLLWLSGEIVVAAARYPFFCIFRSTAERPFARGLWLHHSSRRALRILGLEPRVTGSIAPHGLLVCNHLSYLDVLVLAAIAPSVFVSKDEVKSWPLFGWFARLSGTIFVHRGRRMQTRQTADEMAAALDRGLRVVLFPEGTSSGGDTVLPFKSSLLDPAIRTARPLSVGLIGYELEDGDVVEEVCYWRDMTLVPHVMNLLSKSRIRALVRFAPWHDRTTDRKELARQLHSEILRMKQTCAL